MSEIILTCEYIVSPILSKKETIVDQIESLIELKELISTQRITPLFEDDLLGKLISYAQFPTESSIKNNLTSQEIKIYSAKDISKLINNIIQNINNTLEPIYIEWHHKNIENDFIESINESRKRDIEEVLDALVYNLQFNNRSIDLIYYSEIFKKTSLNIIGKIKETIPSQNTKTNPCENFEIGLSNNHFVIYNEIDSLNLYRTSINSEDILFSIKAELNKNKLSLRSLGINNIYIGEKFHESCNLNQSLGDSPFSSVTFEKILYVIKNIKSSNLGKYYTYAGSGIQKTANKAKAHREHITSAGIGLRLMYWIDEDSNIEFSNIGPKKEEVIYYPNFI